MVVGKGSYWISKTN